MKPDFGEYSLALVKEDRILFSSDKTGLRPLIECINNNSELKDCILYDKIVGLAAARLIVYSGIISSVITDLASKQAIELLEENKITIDPKKIVDNILNKDKSFVCPMERRAEASKNNKDFFLEINKIYER